jgi:WD40 repeat protein
MISDLPGHAGSVFAVDWAPNGEVVASGGADKMLKLYAAIFVCHHLTLCQVEALRVLRRKEQRRLILDEISSTVYFCRSYRIFIATGLCVDHIVTLTDMVRGTAWSLMSSRDEICGLSIAWSAILYPGLS